MADSFNSLVNRIESSAIREIVEKEFSGNEHAAKVGIRMNVIVDEINGKLDTLSSQMSDVFGKVDRIEKHLEIDKNEPRLDRIERKLDTLVEISRYPKRRRKVKK